MRKLRNRFGILIAEKEHRDSRKYTYKDITEATGILAAALTKWNQNRITRFDAKVLENLCNFLDCDIGDLLELVED